MKARLIILAFAGATVGSAYGQNILITPKTKGDINRISGYYSGRQCLTDYLLSKDYEVNNTAKLERQYYDFLHFLNDKSKNYVYRTDKSKKYWWFLVFGLRGNVFVHVKLENGFAIYSQCKVSK